MILEEIESKLKEIDNNVFYGMADSEDIKNTNKWDYIVFSRKTLSADTQKNSYAEHFVVGIVRENYIPEGLDESVITKMREIAGMRLASPDSQYSYVQKPNTNTVVELLTIEFVKPRKRAVQ